MGPGTGAYLVRYQCHLRVSAVHSSCNQDLRGKAALLLVWDSPSQFQRHDRVGLVASLEVKGKGFYPDPEGWIEELGIGPSLPPSFLAARSGMQAVTRVKYGWRGVAFHAVCSILPLSAVCRDRALDGFWGFVVALLWPYCPNTDRIVSCLSDTLHWTFLTV